MRNIHLITAFSRYENFTVLFDAYKPMNIFWHIILFQDEWEKFDELWTPYKDCGWVFPVVIPMPSKKYEGIHYNYKKNWFIKHCDIVDEDYYVAVDDDDMYEKNVFDKIKQMDDDIVIISMKRGHHIPKDVPDIRKYPTSTLIAHPDNVKIGYISSQQYFVKGRIFREHLFNKESHCADGEMIVYYKESGEQIRYEPTLFALFNYYEPGRWNRGKKII